MGVIKEGFWEGRLEPGLKNRQDLDSKEEGPSRRDCGLSNGMEGAMSLHREWGLA